MACRYFSFGDCMKDFTGRTFWLPTKLIQLLEERAKEEDRSCSSFVRRSLEAALDVKPSRRKVEQRP